MASYLLRFGPVVPYNDPFWYAHSADRIVSGKGYTVDLIFPIAYDSTYPIHSQPEHIRPPLQFYRRGCVCASSERSLGYSPSLVSCIRCSSPLGLLRCEDLVQHTDSTMGSCTHVAFPIRIHMVGIGVNRSIFHHLGSLDLLDGRV